MGKMERRSPQEEGAGEDKRVNARMLYASLLSPSSHYRRPCEQSTEVEFCKFNTQDDNFTPTQPSSSLCLILPCSHFSSD